MYALFVKGGPVMWPLLVVSIVALSTVIERMAFLWNYKRRSQPELPRAMLRRVEAGKINEAIDLGRHSQDPVAKTLVHGLIHRSRGLSGNLVHAGSKELSAFTEGMPILDTIVTLSPLLGLLGTVTGMIRAFGLLGEQELAAPVAITGGIAEALIATAFGLAIAILSLIPLNVVSACFEQVKREIEQSSSEMELLLAQAEPEYDSREDPVRVS